MKNAMLKRISCGVFAALFLINDVAYGLSPMPGSEIPPTQNKMAAMARDTLLARKDPGIVPVIERMRASRPSPAAKLPELKGVRPVKVDWENPPKEWKNNPMLAMTDLVEALQHYMDNESHSEHGRITVVKTPLHVDKGIPLAEYEETRMPDGSMRYRLLVNESLCKAWEDMRKNDIWFTYVLPSGEERVVSVAYGIFNWIAKHEATDLRKLDFERGILTPKDGARGHITRGETEPERSEETANYIGGNYTMPTIAIKLFFFGAYCAYSDAHRHDSNTFLAEIGSWFDENRPESYEEFPALVRDPRARQEAFALADYIRARYFSRPGVRALKIENGKKPVAGEKKLAAAANKDFASKPPAGAQEAGKGQTQLMPNEAQEQGGALVEVRPAETELIRGVLKPQSRQMALVTKIMNSPAMIEAMQKTGGWKDADAVRDTLKAILVKGPDAAREEARWLSGMLAAHSETRAAGVALADLMLDRIVEAEAHMAGSHEVIRYFDPILNENLEGLIKKDGNIQFKCFNWLFNRFLEESSLAFSDPENFEAHVLYARIILKHFNIILRSTDNERWTSLRIRIMMRFADYLSGEWKGRNQHIIDILTLLYPEASRDFMLHIVTNFELVNALGGDNTKALLAEYGGIEAFRAATETLLSIACYEWPNEFFDYLGSHYASVPPHMQVYYLSAMRFGVYYLEEGRLEGRHIRRTRTIRPDRIGWVVEEAIRLSAYQGDIIQPRCLAIFHAFPGVLISKLESIVPPPGGTGKAVSRYTTLFTAGRSFIMQALLGIAARDDEHASVENRIEARRRILPFVMYEMAQENNAAIQQEIIAQGYFTPEILGSLTPENSLILRTCIIHEYHHFKELDLCDRQCQHIMAAIGLPAIEDCIAFYNQHVKNDYRMAMDVLYLGASVARTFRAKNDDERQKLNSIIRKLLALAGETLMKRKGAVDEYFALRERIAQARRDIEGMENVVQAADLAADGIKQKMRKVDEDIGNAQQNVVGVNKELEILRIQSDELYNELQRLGMLLGWKALLMRAMIWPIRITKLDKLGRRMFARWYGISSDDTGKSASARKSGIQGRTTVEEFDQMAADIVSGEDAGSGIDLIDVMVEGEGESAQSAKLAVTPFEELSILQQIRARRYTYRQWRANEEIISDCVRNIITLNVQIEKLRKQVKALEPQMAVANEEFFAVRKRFDELNRFLKQAEGKVKTVRQAAEEKQEEKSAREQGLPYYRDEVPEGPTLKAAAETKVHTATQSVNDLGRALRMFFLSPSLNGEMARECLAGLDNLFPQTPAPAEETAADTAAKPDTYPDDGQAIMTALSVALNPACGMSSADVGRICVRLARHMGWQAEHGIVRDEVGDEVRFLVDLAHRGELIPAKTHDPVFMTIQSQLIRNLRRPSSAERMGKVAEFAQNARMVAGAQMRKAIDNARKIAGQGAELRRVASQYLAMKFPNDKAARERLMRVYQVSFDATGCQTTVQTLFFMMAFHVGNCGSDPMRTDGEPFPEPKNRAQHLENEYYRYWKAAHDLKDRIFTAAREEFRAEEGYGWEQAANKEAVYYFSEIFRAPQVPADVAAAAESTLGLKVFDPWIAEWHEARRPDQKPKEHPLNIDEYTVLANIASYLEGAPEVTTENILAGERVARHMPAYLNSLSFNFARRAIKVSAQIGDSELRPAIQILERMREIIQPDVTVKDGEDVTNVRQTIELALRKLKEKEVKPTAEEAIALPFIARIRIAPPAIAPKLLEGPVTTVGMARLTDESKPAKAESPQDRPMSAGGQKPFASQAPADAQAQNRHTELTEWLRERIADFVEYAFELGGARDFDVKFHLAGRTMDDFNSPEADFVKRAEETRNSTRALAIAAGRFDKRTGKYHELEADDDEAFLDFTFPVYRGRTYDRRMSPAIRNTQINTITSAIQDVVSDYIAAKERLGEKFSVRIGREDDTLVIVFGSERAEREAKAKRTSDINKKSRGTTSANGDDDEDIELMQKGLGDWEGEEAAEEDRARDSVRELIKGLTTSNNYKRLAARKGLLSIVEEAGAILVLETLEEEKKKAGSEKNKNLIDTAIRFVKANVANEIALEALKPEAPKPAAQEPGGEPGRGEDNTSLMAAGGGKDFASKPPAAEEAGEEARARGPATSPKATWEVIISSDAFTLSRILTEGNDGYITAQAVHDEFAKIGRSLGYAKTPSVRTIAKNLALMSDRQGPMPYLIKAGRGRYDTSREGQRIISGIEEALKKETVLLKRKGEIHERLELCFDLIKLGYRIRERLAIIESLILDPKCHVSYKSWAICRLAGNQEMYGMAMPELAALYERAIRAMPDYKEGPEFFWQVAHDAHYLNHPTIVLAKYALIRQKIFTFEDLSLLESIREATARSSHRIGEVQGEINDGTVKIIDAALAEVSRQDESMRSMAAGGKKTFASKPAAVMAGEKLSPRFLQAMEELYGEDSSDAGHAIFSRIGLLEEADREAFLSVHRGIDSIIEKMDGIFSRMKQARAPERFKVSRGDIFVRMHGGTKIYCLILEGSRQVKPGHNEMSHPVILEISKPNGIKIREAFENELIGYDHAQLIQIDADLAPALSELAEYIRGVTVNLHSIHKRLLRKVDPAKATAMILEDITRNGANADFGKAAGQGKTQPAAISVFVMIEGAEGLGLAVNGEKILFDIGLDSQEEIRRKILQYLSTMMNSPKLSGSSINHFHYTPAEFNAKTGRSEAGLRIYVSAATPMSAGGGKDFASEARQTSANSEGDEEPEADYGEFAGQPFLFTMESLQTNDGDWEGQEAAEEDAARAEVSKLLKGMGSFAAENRHEARRKLLALVKKQGADFVLRTLSEEAQRAKSRKQADRVDAAMRFVKANVADEIALEALKPEAPKPAAQEPGGEPGQGESTRPMFAGGARTFASEAEQEHPLIRIIAQYKLPFAKEAAPVSAELPIQAKTDIWALVNLLHDDKISVLVPQQGVALTDMMQGTLRDIRKARKSDVVECKQFATEKGLKEMLEQNMKAGKKTIVITTGIDSVNQVSNASMSRPDLFKQARSMNIKMPDGYNAMPSDDRTFFQADMIMKAICARLYEPDGSFEMKRLMEGMLERSYAGDKAKFLEGLVEKENENDWQTTKRICDCSTRVVQLLSKKVADAIELLKLEMKEFWTAA